MKKYTHAPLPFVGQKRAMLKLIVPLLYKCAREGIFAPRAYKMNTSHQSLIII